MCRCGDVVFRLSVLITLLRRDVPVSSTAALAILPCWPFVSAFCAQRTAVAVGQLSLAANKTAVVAAAEETG